MVTFGTFGYLPDHIGLCLHQPTATLPHDMATPSCLFARSLARSRPSHVQMHFM